ncbi:MAG: hypothetical protein P8177_10215 [Gemmatimonadota bacterium]
MLPALALLLTACGAAGPTSFTAPVPRSADADPYACALRQVNELGFTVVDADRASGFLVAEKQTTGALETFFGDAHEFDRLTVSIYDDGADGRTLRVTAGEVSRGGEEASGSESPEASGIEAAQAVLRACSTGEIRQRGGEGGGDAGIDATIPDPGP